MAPIPVMFQSRVLYAGAYRFPCRFNSDDKTYFVILDREEEHTKAILEGMIEAFPKVSYDDGKYDPGFTLVSFVPVQEKEALNAYLTKDGKTELKKRPDAGDTLLPKYEELRHCLTTAGYFDVEITAHSRAVFEVLLEGDFTNALYIKHNMEQNNIPVRGYSFKNGKVAFLCSYYEAKREVAHAR